MGAAIGAGGGEKADRVSFAEFREPDTIHIYMDAVKKAGKFLAKPEISEILTDKLDIANLLLAHELFHFVEEKYKKEIFTRTEKVRFCSLGFPLRDGRIFGVWLFTGGSQRLV